MCSIRTQGFTSLSEAIPVNSYSIRKKTESKGAHYSKQITGILKRKLSKSEKKDKLTDLWVESRLEKKSGSFVVGLLLALLAADARLQKSTDKTKRGKQK